VHIVQTPGHETPDRLSKNLEGLKRRRRAILPGYLSEQSDGEKAGRTRGKEKF